MNIIQLVYTREGFEADAAQELKERGQALGITLDYEIRTDQGFIASRPLSRSDAKKLWQNLVYQSLVFPRQIVYGVALAPGMRDDRTAAILAAIQDELLPFTGANAFSEFWLEAPDTNDGRTIRRSATKFRSTLDQALNRERLLPKGPGAKRLPRLHFFEADQDRAWVATSDPARSSAWAMGIPRLKMPKGAPSRSTLKLEEAFHVFLDDKTRREALGEGMTVVDLGAAPGGWTYQFVSRGMYVTAIDNAAMAPALLKTGMVDHKAADALRWQPKERVDWMVCDIVEQPRRITELVSHWIRRDLAVRIIFNLKLPMKRRWDELRVDLATLNKAVGERRKKTLLCRQLYHDRKEVTCYFGPE